MKKEYIKKGSIVKVTDRIVQLSPAFTDTAACFPCQFIFIPKSQKRWEPFVLADREGDGASRLGETAGELEDTELAVESRF